ncbi:MAG: hypothetical protein H6608_08995 [Flavobacteriales bacterium]|nr:hypothetical protein [Flavobacteriales bacterium]
MKRHFRNFLLTVAFGSFSWMASAQVYAELGISYLNPFNGEQTVTNLGHLVKYGKRYNKTTLTFSYSYRSRLQQTDQFGGASIGRLFSITKNEKCKAELNVGYLYYHLRGEANTPGINFGFDVAFAKVSVLYEFNDRWYGRYGISRGLARNHWATRYRTASGWSRLDPHQPEITIGYRFGG